MRLKALKFNMKHEMLSSPPNWIGTHSGSFTNRKHEARTKATLHSRRFKWNPFVCYTGVRCLFSPLMSRRDSDRATHYHHTAASDIDSSLINEHYRAVWLLRQSACDLRSCRCVRVTQR